MAILDRNSKEAWSHHPDKVLVQQAQSEDEDALNALIQRYWSRLVESATRRCGRCLFVGDCCQRACLTAAARVADLRSPEAFGCWIQRILQNEIRHCSRKCKKVETNHHSGGPYLVENLSVKADETVLSEILEVLRGESDFDSGERGRIARFIYEYCVASQELPPVREIAKATGTNRSAAHRHKVVLLQTWRRALLALSFAICAASQQRSIYECL